MMHRNQLFSAIWFVLVLGSTAGFSPSTTSLVSKSRTALAPTTLFVRSSEEKDWFEEMEQQSYESLREHKEPLFDHDDWAELRRPNRRLDDTFDFMFPGIVAFLIYLIIAAVLM